MIRLNLIIDYYDKSNKVIFTMIILVDLCQLQNLHKDIDDTMITHGMFFALT